MLASSQKRAPGAGRKPQGEFRGNSAVLTVRLRPELRRALEQLARRRRHSLSQEMQSALKSWVGRNPKPHIGRLAHAVTLLVEGIEQITGRRWIKDPFTGAAVRHGIERLTFHFAPFPDGPSAVPVNVEKSAAKMPPQAGERHRTPAGFGEDQASLLVAMIENAAASDKPAGLQFLDERGLWQILRDLGSGWNRNRKEWLPKESRQ
jgi:hypothetical protein